MRKKENFFKYVRLPKQRDELKQSMTCILMDWGTAVLIHLHLIIVA